MARGQLVENDTNSKKQLKQGNSKFSRIKGSNQGTSYTNRNLCHLCREEHNLRIYQKFFDYS